MIVSRAGSISFFLALALIAYVIIVVLLGAIVNAGPASQDSTIQVIGVLLLIGFVLSFVGIVLGAIGMARNDENRSRALVGLAGNALVMILIVGSLFLGIAV